VLRAGSRLRRATGPESVGVPTGPERHRETPAAGAPDRAETGDAHLLLPEIQLCNAHSANVGHSGPVVARHVGRVEYTAISAESGARGAPHRPSQGDSRGALDDPGSRPRSSAGRSAA